MYFIIYSFINAIGIKIINLNKILFLQEIMIITKKNRLDFISIIVVFFSIAGIPPFLGFLPKAIILIKIIENSLLFLRLRILILNTITRFFYLRLSYIRLILSLNIKKEVKYKPKNRFPWFLLLTLFPLGLILWNFKLKQTINFQN